MSESERKIFKKEIKNTSGFLESHWMRPEDSLASYDEKISNIFSYLYIIICHIYSYIALPEDYNNMYCSVYIYLYV